ncbi:hypothetical protein GCM10022419_104650 [Nonomuraea rosea]|uniref:Uncharacterized protein n=1 Tax=Nonomuraea rosea TaxID=638574 RepID=A0ABP6ZBS4_9ACTN
MVIGSCPSTRTRVLSSYGLAGTTGPVPSATLTGHHGNPEAYARKALVNQTISWRRRKSVELPGAA